MHHTCGFLTKTMPEAKRHYFFKYRNKTKLLIKEKKVLSNVLRILHPPPVSEFSNQPGLGCADMGNKSMVRSRI